VFCKFSLPVSVSAPGFATPEAFNTYRWFNGAIPLSGAIPTDLNRTLAALAGLFVPFGFCISILFLVLRTIEGGDLKRTANRRRQLVEFTKRDKTKNLPSQHQVHGAGSKERRVKRTLMKK
jgi:hypothetical protein